MRFLISVGMVVLLALTSLSLPSVASGASTVRGPKAESSYGSRRATYLKFELEKVSIVSIEFHGLGAPIRSKVLRVSGLPARLQTDRRMGRMRSRRPAALTATLTGKRQHRPIKILKPVDKATPLIQRALVNNQLLPRAVLLGRHKQTGQSVRIVLQRVAIQGQTSQSAGRSSSGLGGVQTEMVALNLRGY